MCTHRTQGFCVTIEHVKSLSSSDLLTGLKSKGLRSPDISRALGNCYHACSCTCPCVPVEDCKPSTPLWTDRLITTFPQFKIRYYVFPYSHTVKEKLTTDSDSEISATSLRISLICPVSLESRSYAGNLS